MAKYKVTLEISTKWNPNKWNWAEMLDFSDEGDSLDWVHVETVKEKRV